MCFFLSSFPAYTFFSNFLLYFPPFFRPSFPPPSSLLPPPFIPSPSSVHLPLLQVYGRDNGRAGGKQLDHDLLRSRGEKDATSYPIPHTSYLIPHTSHLIPHTSHTSYLTPHTSHLTPHTSHLSSYNSLLYTNTRACFCTLLNPFTTGGNPRHRNV